MKLRPPFRFDLTELATSSLCLCVLVLREGAIDRLVNIYKDVVHKTGVSVYTRTHARTHTRTRAYTQTHTQCLVFKWLSVTLLHAPANWHWGRPAGCWDQSRNTIRMRKVGVSKVRLLIGAGLPDGERLCQPGASGDDHAGSGRGRGQHLQETQGG